MKKCLQCRNETNNPKFCSRSCAGIYNNEKYYRSRLQPTRKYFCKTCNALIGIGAKYRKTYCVSCRPKQVIIDWSTITLEQIFNKLPNFQAHARIRELGRRCFYQSSKIKACQYCGYSKFIEVCHIIPICKFDKTTLISIVNDINNLIGLCPNHHWELDHGLLVMSESGIEPVR